MLGRITVAEKLPQDNPNEAEDSKSVENRRPSACVDQVPAQSHGDHVADLSTWQNRKISQS